MTLERILRNNNLGSTIVMRTAQLNSALRRFLLTATQAYRRLKLDLCPTNLFVTQPKETVWKIK
jgi:hypothetical protein